MVRMVNAIYSASDDPNWGDPVQEKVILIAPDMIIEVQGDELTFLIIPEVPGDQNTVEVDRAECRYFRLDVQHADYDFIAKASLLDFIRLSAKK